MQQFLDTQLRIIQFEIIGEPPLDASLEDKIKKEIFRRYNTGITPLRNAEIDNAVYDSDGLTEYLKESFEKKSGVAKKIQDLFLPAASGGADFNLPTVLQFIRRMVVLCKYPIRYYARASGRMETLDRLYDYYAQHDCDDPSKIFSQIEKFVEAVWNLKQTAETRNVKTNRFFWECVLWAMLVLDQEGKNCISIVSGMTEKLMQLAANEASVFFDDASHHFQVIVGRYSCTAKLFQEQTGVDYAIYLAGTEEIVRNLKSKEQAKDTETQTSQLSELRVNKPQPSQLSIEDILNNMKRRRFLLRPSYQRGEVINPIKASGIIESILLGVTLPPIFVFKRNDGVSEVVDGQQRLLTILGFIGEPYLNEKNEQAFSKNNRFALRDLRILTELSGKRNDDLSQGQKEKIFDFELFVVEIQESLNPNFNPVDLFVRLNDKPYPIKEHSFEMWNSWADKDCITKIKDNTDRHSEWFYMRKRQKDDRYRMQNEELYTSLIYFDYNGRGQVSKKHPAIFSRRDSISARVQVKSDISKVLAEVSQNAKEKERWLDSTKQVESLISKLKIVLVDKDVSRDVATFLRGELDKMFISKKQKYAVRTSQDFYFLWLMLNPLNLEMVRFHRLEIKSEMLKLMQWIKAGVTDSSQPTDLVSAFYDRLKEFHDRYRKEDRKLKLSESQKAEMIHKQKGTCAISDAPIFVGDDLAADHTDSLATGGPDSLENMKMVTPEANSRKGHRRSDAPIKPS